MDTKQNKLGIALIALFMSVSSIALAQNLTSEADSISYGIGVVFADQLKSKGITEVNTDILAKAMAEYFSGTTHITLEEGQNIMMLHMAKVKKERMSKAKEDGEKFLAENAKKPGVKVTESGLQYEVIKSGLGDAHPTMESTVETHYHGMLVDGTVFDSSVNRGKTISFPLGKVIKGWIEGLQLMKVGDKFRFFIPSDLAYGPNGSGGIIPPHAALIFEVELFDIK